MRTAIVVLATLVGCANLAFADMAATVDTDAIAWTNSAGRTAMGWRFFAKKEFTITHLGLFDYGVPGLSNTHTLGIWRVKKEGGLTPALREVQIGPGEGTSIDHHIFVDIEDFTITPDPVPWTDEITGLPYVNPETGEYYYERWIVGVWNPEGNGDMLILPQEAATILAESAGFIRMESQLIRNSDAFTYPWSGVSSDYFGVNFLYTPNVVPVPGAVLLGVIGLAYAARRLRRERA